MSLEEKFKLLEPVPAVIPDPEAALLARDVASGAPVVVHVLADTAANLTLLEQVRHLPPAHSPFILAIGELGAYKCVASRFLPGDASLAAWVDSLGLPAASPAPVPPPAPAHSSPKPGAFTMMVSQVTVNDLLRQHESSGTVPATPQWSAPPPPAADVAKPLPTPTPAAIPQPEPGEFTRLFGSAPGTPAPPAAPKFAPPAAPLAPPVAPTFAPPTATLAPLAAPPPAPPAAPDPEPGEFTKLFGNLKPPAPKAPAPEATPSAPTPAPIRSTRTFTPPAGHSDQSAIRFAPLQTKMGPGRFTEMVQKPFVAPAPPPVPPSIAPELAQGSTSKNFTGLFKLPLEAELAAKPAVQQPQPQQPQQPAPLTPIAPPDFQEARTRLDSSFPPPLARPPARSSPMQSQNDGEFTRLLQGNGPPSPSQPPPASSKGAGEFTRMLQGASFGEAPSRMAPPPAPAADPLFGPTGPVTGQRPGDATGAFINPAQNAPMLSQGSSEFTRMFNAPPPAAFGAQAPPVKQAPPAPAPPTAAKKARDRMLVILVVSLLLFAAIALVLFFALDK